MPEQTDAEFLRFVAENDDRLGDRLRAIADSMEAEAPSTDEPVSTLPALLTECPDPGCRNGRRGVVNEVRCSTCHGTGKVLTPAGEQVVELIEWVDRVADDLLARAEKIARCTPFIEPDAGAAETAQCIRDLAAALRAVLALAEGKDDPTGRPFYVKTKDVLRVLGLYVTPFEPFDDDDGVTR